MIPTLRSVKPTVLHAKKPANHNPLLATALLGLVLASPLPAQAYDPSDYASETVTEVVKSLKDASGDSDATFSVYEEIAAIITEGKGVGGSINYRKSHVIYVLNHKNQPQLKHMLYMYLPFIRGSSVGSGIHCG
jgi:hypothetical protein